MIMVAIGLGSSASSLTLAREKEDKQMTHATSGTKLRRHQMISRDVAARALWAAFPSRSEHDLCNRAASVLDTSPNTIRRILRRETDAKLSLVWPILAMGLAARGIDALEAIGAGEP